MGWLIGAGAVVVAVVIFAAGMLVGSWLAEPVSDGAPQATHEVGS